MEIDNILNVINKKPNVFEPDYKMRAKVYEFSDTEYWFLKGYDYQKDEATDDAMDSYRKSIQLDAYNVDSMFNLAGLYEVQKRYSIACKWYKIILKLNPEYVEAHYGYALC